MPSSHEPKVALTPVKMCCLLGHSSCVGLSVSSFVFQMPWQVVKVSPLISSLFTVIKEWLEDSKSLIAHLILHSVQMDRSKITVHYICCNYNLYVFYALNVKRGVQPRHVYNFMRYYSSNLDLTIVYMVVFCALKMITGFVTDWISLLTWSLSFHVNIRASINTGTGLWECIFVRNVCICVYCVACINILFKVFILKFRYPKL